MTDSPAVQAPLDPKEQPILDSILAIRDNLCLLRQDKTRYIKSGDILSLYHQLIESVDALNDIRSEKRDEQNRVDRVLDDCFQLVSLFFLTIGRNNEAPAQYATTSTVKRLLDHLAEVQFYSAKDLESISGTLDNISEAIERGKDKYSPQLVTLLEARLKTCRSLSKGLQDNLSILSPELAPVYEKLVSMIRSMAAANTKSKFPVVEVQGFQAQLKDIRESVADGKFAKEIVPSPIGREPIIDLIDRCLKWSEMVNEREGRVSEAFKPTYEKLQDIRNQLEKLSLTQAWSLRETDLYSYQRQLDRIDEARVNGNFIDDYGNVADLFHQRTMLYLLRRSYAYIYSLIIASEPVSEALLPVYNQLQTLRRCLLEVKKSGGVSSPRELYPYSMKLNSVDNMRVDGKFMVGSEIPEGQGSVNALLAECFEISHDLRVDADSDAE
ncbi:MAG: hypothetical protein M1833_004889 [Piccolia ochrophora]|nr:MAG: hypothetical protein M1833_004889 [Piccolia ochrophora]